MSQSAGIDQTADKLDFHGVPSPRTREHLRAAPIKILHLTQVYTSGVGYAIDNIVKSTPEFEHHLLYAGEMKPASFASTYPLTRGTIKRVRQLRELLKVIQPDIIHAHSTWAGVYARVRQLDIPIFYQPHSYKFADPTVLWPIRKGIRIVERVLAPRAQTLVLCPNEFNQAKSIGTNSITVVPNAPSVPILRRDPSKTNSRTVLMAGRVSKVKGPDFFADVVRESRALGLNLDFVWVGGGSADMELLLRRADVRMTGWVNSETVQRELDQALVYLHTAACEGFPISVLDAAARDVPIIVRKIDAFAGLNLRAVESACEAAQMLMKMLQSEHAMEEVRTPGRLLVEEMNNYKLAKALRIAYAGALASTNR